MIKLVICEKPSQARDIAHILGATNRCDGYLEGNQYQVTWCLGHLLELAPPETYCVDLKPWRLDVLPIKPEQWQLMPKSATSKQLNVIKKLLKNIRHVIIATDADREGDLIGREVLDYCHYQGAIERLWLSALDEKSIRQALSDIKPDSFSRNLYSAGLGRQRADWLVGMNMTMATTVQFSRGTGVLSVGRVQSPTLKLIVDRDRSIEQFQSKDYYDVVIQVANNDKIFTAQWVVPESVADEAGRCLNRLDAEKIQQQVLRNQVTVTHYAEQEKTQKPPLGLSLSQLQKLCSSQFGFSAKDTLTLAQSLYETHKATTYPRTDCQYLPTNQLADALTIVPLLAQLNSDYVRFTDKVDMTCVSPIWNDKKITAHHAIIPTSNAQVDVAKMNSDEKKLYDLICRYYLAQFLGNYRYFQKEVVLMCENDQFKTNSHTPQSLGWKLAIQGTKEEVDSESVQDIPRLTINTELSCDNADIMAKKTKPPARFTEGTLITAMKNIAHYLKDPSVKKILKDTAGIGTEATRANIIETLLGRGYIERKSKQLISTSKGRELIDLLPSLVTDPTMTAQWESLLDDVAHGKHTLDDFLNAQSKLLINMLDAIAKQDAAQSVIPIGEQYLCPACQHVLIKRQGKFGVFWGCSYYPTCKENYKDNKGKPLLDEKKYPCPECDKGMLKPRTGTRGKFWGCSNYPDCKAVRNDHRGKPEQGK